MRNVGRTSGDISKLRNIPHGNPGGKTKPFLVQCFMAEPQPPRLIPFRSDG